MNQPTPAVSCAAKRVMSTATIIDSTFKLHILETAACHFLSNFVLIAPPSTDRGFFEFIVPLLQSALVGDPYSLAFRACSLASVSYREGLNPSLEREAMAYYGKALVATHEALTQPQAATSDSILGTVMLLALFEMQAGVTSVVSGWGSHVNGATELISRRSWSTLASKSGMSLFAAVRVQLVCVVSHFPVKITNKLQLTRNNRSFFRCCLARLDQRAKNGGLVTHSKTNILCFVFILR